MEQTEEKNVSRRAFLGGMATLAASAVLVPGCTTNAPEEEAKEPEGAPAESEPQATSDLPSTGEMTREEALALLNEETEVTEDLVLDDGTVVPALHVRVRNRINRIGTGIGSEVTPEQNYWAFIERAFSDEEAEYYLEMPLTKHFTATEMAVKTGRDEQKCAEMCEALSNRGIIYRMHRAGETFYRLIPQINGIWEFSIGVWDKDDEFDMDYLDKHWLMFRGPGTVPQDSDIPPYFRTLPVDAEIIGDEQVMSPFDDYEAIIRRHSVIARGDCVCRADARAHGTPCEHAEKFKATEILTGEMAEYYIENGIGWPITQDEALQVFRDAIDAGLVIQVTYSKASEVFCCCCGDSCKMLGMVKATGGGRAMAYYSHYSLQHDKDSCIKCGMCASRCHLEAITYDDEGYPVTGPTCVRCGQCAVTCPAEARKLFKLDEYPELPDTLDDTNLEKAIERMQLGYITDFVPEN